MKSLTTAGLRSLVLVLVAGFVAACSEQAPAGPETGDVPAPNLSISGSGQQGLEWEYTDEHIVLFEDGVPGDFDARIAGLGGSVLRVHPEINVAIVTGLTDEASAELAGADDIASAPRDISAQFIPNPAAFGGGETESAPPGGSAPAAHDQTLASFWPYQWNMRIIDADDAWAAGYNDASGVRVAIIDSGLDPFHQDLAGLIDMATSAAFVASVNPSGPPWGDDHTHGSHVGGTVASNGLGTAGVAPHATLIAVKVCYYNGSCPISAILSGIVHAANVDADVINMSIGGFLNVPSPGGGQLNGAYTRAVNYANQQGTLVVTSAGNSAVDLDHIERDYGVNAFRATPCELGNATCVSATGPTDELAYYSNYGRSAINVAGPGGDFSYGTLGGVIAPCSTLTVDPGLAICTTSPDWYVWLHGTSMASPHVAGAAALLDAQSGGMLNPGQLRSSLQRSADDLGRRGADPIYGAGRINVCSLVGC